MFTLYIFHCDTIHFFFTVDYVHSKRFSFWLLCSICFLVTTVFTLYIFYCRLLCLLNKIFLISAVVTLYMFYSRLLCLLYIFFLVITVFSLSMFPLSYFSFQPVLHDWCNKGRGLCYPVCGMVHIKEPLVLIDKSSLCGGSGFPFSLSEWSLTICRTPYNRR